MFCFDCRPVVKLSAEGKRITGIIQILTYVYIFFAILRLFMGDFNNFLNDITIVPMFMVTTSTVNFIMAAITIFFLLLQSFKVTINLLLIIQDYAFGFIIFETFSQYLFVFMILFGFCLNVSLIYYIFLAYREYKALFYEQAQMGYQILPDQERGTINDANSNQPMSGFSAFQGRGATWG